MLWYKAWLETRWRLIFIAALSAIVLTAPLMMGVPQERLWESIHHAMVLPAFFAALFLAGSGINTQSSYTARPGIHGSMFFTLSLPISRRRLFFVRAAVGALETAVFVALLGSIALALSPETLSSAQVLQYLGRAIICAMSVYALSAMLASVLDDVWQFQAGVLCLGGILLLQSRSDLVARFSPLRGMSLDSYPATGAVPWAPIAASLAATAILIFASVQILRRKEY